jgi:hypothetical protein
MLPILLSEGPIGLENGQSTQLLADKFPWRRNREFFAA